VAVTVPTPVSPVTPDETNKDADVAPPQPLPLP